MRRQHQLFKTEKTSSLFFSNDITSRRVHTDVVRRRLVKDTITKRRRTPKLRCVLPHNLGEMRQCRVLGIVRGRVAHEERHRRFRVKRPGPRREIRAHGAQRVARVRELAAGRVSLGEALQVRRPRQGRCTVLGTVRVVGVQIGCDLRGPGRRARRRGGRSPCGCGRLSGASIPLRSRRGSGDGRSGSR